MNTILQQRIEEAAKKYCQDKNYILPDDTELSLEALTAIDAYIEAAKSILNNQWIPVDEALPKEDEQVIAMSEFGDIERMKYHNKAFYHLKGSIIKDGEKITYWMEISRLEGGEK